MTEKPRKSKATHWLITGDDDYAIQQRAAELMKVNAPEDQMSVEVISGHIDSVDAAIRQTGSAIEALQTLPFFGGKKLVHFKDVNFAGDSVQGKSPAVQDVLAKLLEIVTKNDPEQAQIIISCIGIDKRRSFYKKFSEAGKVETFEKPELNRARDMEAWMGEIENRFKERGLVAGPGVVERLVDAAGDDSRRLISEIEKLALYCHPRTRIEEHDAKLLCQGTREMVVWDLCETVTKGKAIEALRLLKQLLFQDERPERLLIALENQVRLAALGVFLLEQGRLKLVDRRGFIDCELAPGAENFIAASRKGEKVSLFPLAKAVNAARHRPSARWFRLIEIVHQAHLDMFGGGGDREQLLESVVLKIASA